MQFNVNYNYNKTKSQSSRAPLQHFVYTMAYTSSTYNSNVFSYYLIVIGSHLSYPLTLTECSLAVSDYEMCSIASKIITTLQYNVYI